ncbi:hypothetical protein GGU11DRAFT_663793, partial [Lentinula aff. detonsa]
ARAFLIGSGLPKFLWAEAVNHAVWLRNRFPNGDNHKSAFERVHGRKPSFKDLMAWGAPVYIRDMKSDKIGLRGIEGKFVGYDSESKGIRVYWPD